MTPHGPSLAHSPGGSSGSASDPSSRRLFLLQTVVIALLLTLFGRLYFLQVANSSIGPLVNASTYKQVITTAPRGIIVDDAGNKLVDNQAALVVTLSRTTLDSEKASVRQAVINRLAGTLLINPSDLAKSVESCTKDNPPPTCNPGSPFQPVAVKTYPETGPGKVDEATIREVYQTIKEHPDEYPGVVVTAQAVRTYPVGGALPNTTLAAQALGHLGPVIPDDLKAGADYASEAKLLTTTDNGVTQPRQEDVGRGGLEQQYDASLRGLDGVQTLTVNKSGDVTGTAKETASVQGDDLVLNLDDTIQKAAESALQYGISLTQTYPLIGGGTADDGAAAVVMTTDGRVVALASTPSFDETAFDSTKTYNALVNDAKKPLVNRAAAGVYPPGSSFKPITSSAILADGINSADQYEPCPQTIPLGNLTVHNFEGEAPSGGDLAHQLEVSCDTYFANVGAQEWIDDGGYRQTATQKKQPDHEYLAKMALAYGFGKSVGVDLPEGSPGLVVDRVEQAAIYKQNKASYCAGAKSRTKGSYLQRLDYDNCHDGALYNEGDAAYFAIGQGSNLEVTPLQMARAYAAIANGGTLYDPTLGKALVRPNGAIDKVLTPKVAGHVPVSETDLQAIEQGMYQVTHVADGTGYGVFGDYPVSVCGKTGTAEVISADKNGQALPGTDTSWFGSFAPCDPAHGVKPKYVVMVVVPKSNQGAEIAAPVARKIYDAIYKVTGSTVAAKNGPTGTVLPCFRTNGSISAPSTRCPHPVVGAPKAKDVTPTPSANPSASDAVTPMPASTEPDKRGGKR